MYLGHGLDLSRSIYIPFLVTRLQVRPLDGFSRAMAQTTRSQARVCLLGVRKLRNNIQPLKNPPNVKIRGKNWTDENRPL